jgi:hypothetical protein
MKSIGGYACDCEGKKAHWGTKIVCFIIGKVELLNFYEKANQQSSRTAAARRRVTAFPSRQLMMMGWARPAAADGKP